MSPGKHLGARSGLSRPSVIGIAHAQPSPLLASSGDAGQATSLQPLDGSRPGGRYSLPPTCAGAAAAEGQSHWQQPSPACAGVFRPEASSTGQQQTVPTLKSPCPCLSSCSRFLLSPEHYNHMLLFCLQLNCGLREEERPLAGQSLHLLQFLVHKQASTKCLLNE